MWDQSQNKSFTFRWSSINWSVRRLRHLYICLVYWGSMWTRSKFWMGWGFNDSATWYKPAYYFMSSLSNCLSAPSLRSSLRHLLSIWWNCCKLSKYILKDSTHFCETANALLLSGACIISLIFRQLKDSTHFCETANALLLSGACIISLIFRQLSRSSDTCLKYCSICSRQPIP